MRLKICGITNKRDLHKCLTYVDAIGFIVGYPQSPRNISFKKAKELLSFVPPFVTTVVVIPNFQKVKQLYSELRPDVIQLHGKETIDDVKKCRKEIPCTLIKACSVNDAKAYSAHVDAVLIDDKFEQYDILDVKKLINQISKPVILAGHINPDNLLDILQQVQPYAIDIASGVEKRPGIKDIKKIRQIRKQIDLGSTVGSIIQEKTKLQPFQLYKTIKSKKQIHIITEVKPSSPSKGCLRDIEKDLNEIITNMEEGGTSAISVLVEPLFFHGSLDLIKKVRQQTNLPIIAKGFFFEERHISELAKAGANAFLLMARVVESQNGGLNRLLKVGETHGLDAIVEVANNVELRRTIASGARIIEINNRDIYDDLSIDFNHIKIGTKIPSDVVLISASGVSTKRDIKNLYYLSKDRIDAFLIGTSIMQSKNIQKKVRSFVQTGKVIYK